MGEMLGFNATILPFAEVPQAFSTGLIEAMFTSPQTGIDIQAWDNTSHFTYAGAMLNKNAVIVSERYFSEIGSAHVCTPDTNAHLVFRLLLAKKTLPLSSRLSLPIDYLHEV